MLASTSGKDSTAEFGETAGFVRRIQKSEILRRSDRLKELLAYLMERTGSDPEAAVREQDIGTDVYGRGRDYDTSHDTIVRVQVAQLRKKLERYYVTEGADDELVLTIPRGRYQVLWNRRAEPRPDVVEESAPAEAVPAPSAEPVHSRGKFAASIGLLVAILLVGAIVLPQVLAWQNSLARHSPSVARLWSGLLVPGRTTHVVLSDPGIVMLATATGRRVRFSELGDRLFLNRVASITEDDHFKSFLQGVASSQLTTLSDLELVRRVTALGMSDPSMMNIVVARDFRIRELNAQNTILVGYGLSNPWVEVFQQSNFVLDFDPATKTHWVTNRHPRSNEPAKFFLGDPKVSNPAQGFATVALFPNPTNSGKTLIISGADVPGTESAIRFLMNEDIWESFHRRIAVRGEVPSFEVVLAYRRLSNSSGNVEPVAWRVY